MSEPLLILGASTRAAAGSAIRAGLRPSAADLFSDLDLHRLVEAPKRIQNYPGDLPSLAREFPPSPWMFTGALENHVQIVGEIAAERTLWGTPHTAIQGVRDPWRLAQCFREAGLRYPEVMQFDQRATIRPQSAERWLLKPFRSAGGGNIRCWEVNDVGSESVSPTGDPRDHSSRDYLQRIVDGESQSAVFVAAGGAAQLLGVTQQLIGATWTGATGFRYAGSIGPLLPSAAHLAIWRAIGDCLAHTFELQGLFGVDAIVREDEIWTIEVNPRYTSSIEVLEFGYDFHALAEHVAACRDGRLNDRVPLAQTDRFRGKAVLYASRDLRIDDDFALAAVDANRGQTWPVIADVPWPKQTIPAGRPVATVFASANQLSVVEPRLREIARTWRTAWKL